MKIHSASLRWRMTLAFGLLGMVLSGLFACATIFITEYYEEVLLDGMLGSFAADIGARHARQESHPLILPQSHTLQGFLRKGDGSGVIPEEYRSLPLGMHELDVDVDHDVRVGVFELGPDRLYLAIDLADVEPLESDLELILAAIVILGSLIAAWLGWSFAGRTIAPVRRLAEAVNALPPHAKQTHLALNAADDEVGRLAAAIDDYQDRLGQAEARERAFFADASHELRTPLAVVRGSADLLLDNTQLRGHSRTQLERIERGVQTLSDLLEVLLGLARGITSTADSIETLNWLDQVLIGMQARERIEIHASPEAQCLVLRPREAGLVVRGIVRRLDRSRISPKLRIVVEANELRLEATSPSSDPCQASNENEGGDKGLGATLIGRLAAKMEWVIDESHAHEGLVSIRIPTLPDSTS